MSRKRSGARWWGRRKATKVADLSRIMFPEVWGLVESHPEWWGQPVTKRSSFSVPLTAGPGGRWATYRSGSKRRVIAAYPGYRLTPGVQEQAGGAHALRSTIGRAPKGGPTRNTAARELNLIRAGAHNLFSKPYIKGYKGGLRGRYDPNQPRNWRGRWTK